MKAHDTWSKRVQAYIDYRQFRLGKILPNRKNWLFAGS